MRVLALIVGCSCLHACASSARAVGTGDSRDAFGRVCDVFATLVREPETASSLAKEARSQVTAEEARTRSPAQGTDVADTGEASCAEVLANTTAQCEAMKLLAHMDQAAKDSTQQVNKAILGDAAKNAASLTLAAKDENTIKATLTADSQAGCNFMTADNSEDSKPTKCLAQAMIFLCNDAHSSLTNERCGKNSGRHRACPCDSDDEHTKLVACISDKRIGFQSESTTAVATAAQAWEKVKQFCQTRPQPRHASRGPATSHTVLNALAALEDALRDMSGTKNCLGKLCQAHCKHADADNQHTCVCFGNDIKKVE
ncbi:hypothetical protein ERJ75_001261300 [Trypanosoma vivax]|nr:hypothetical protein ERJ75_001261300 [Trypanosoma vivax]